MMHYSLLLAVETANPGWIEALRIISYPLTVFASSYLVYLFSLRQKKKEVFIELAKIKYNRKLDALEGCWKLLQYMTDLENVKSILIWEKEREKETKTYYVNIHLVNEFINELSSYFYQSGLGIYLPVAVKEKLFAYQRLVFKFWLKYSKSEENKIKIENEKMAEGMIAVYKELVKCVKQETDLIDKVEVRTFN